MRKLDLVAFGNNRDFWLEDIIAGRLPPTLEEVRFTTDPSDIFDLELPLQGLAANLRLIKMHYIVTHRDFADADYLELCRPFCEALEAVHVPRSR